VFNTAIQAAPLLQRSFKPNGMLASLTDANARTTNYTYDGLDRRASTAYPERRKTASC
jgi:YD repeat-containing protein